MKTERRFASGPVGLETRDGGKKVISGLGAVFFDDANPGTEFELASWGGFKILERIMPGAFDRAIQERDDARGLFNHDPSHLLGRVSSGTMRLSVDSQGLRYEIDIDAEDSDHQKVVRKIERGDLTGSSFAFVPRRVVWVEEEDRDIRQIEDLELFDTGPVTYPAYEASTTGVRSQDLASIKTEWEGWRSHRKEKSRPSAVAVRSRLVELGLTS